MESMGRKCFTLLCTVLCVRHWAYFQATHACSTIFRKELHYQILRKFDRKFSCWHYATDGRRWS